MPDFPGITVVFGCQDKNNILISKPVWGERELWHSTPTELTSCVLVKVIAKVSVMDRVSQLSSATNIKHSLACHRTVALKQLTNCKYL